MIPREYDKYESTVTLAAVNWKGEWGNKAANLEKIQEKVREAARQGVNMLCFPELALTGYKCGEEARQERKPCTMHIGAAETIPGPATEEIARLAKELDIYVILGMPERDAEDPDVRYISAAVIGPEGILGRYRKIHLATPPVWTEYYCFKTGSELPLFETRYGPVGVQICADFWMYPELSRILALKGARIIFHPTGSAAGPGKIDMMKYVPADRGRLTQAYIVTCNHAGKERKASYCGHSTIAGPGSPYYFGPLAQGKEGEDLVYTTVNFQDLASAQDIYRVKEAGNWKLIASEYQKIAELAGRHGY